MKLGPEGEKTDGWLFFWRRKNGLRNVTVQMSQYDVIWSQSQETVVRKSCSFT